MEKVKINYHIHNNDFSNKVEDFFWKFDGMSKREKILMTLKLKSELLNHICNKYDNVTLYAGNVRMQLAYLKLCKHELIRAGIDSELYISNSSLSMLIRSLEGEL